MSPVEAVTVGDVRDESKLNAVGGIFITHKITIASAAAWTSANRTFLTVVIGRFCQITVKLEAFSSLLHLLCCSPHFPFLWSFFNLRLSLFFTLRVPVRTELQSNTAPLPPCCGSAPAVYSVNENTCNAKLRTSP